MIVYSLYSIRTNVTNLHCEDSVGIYTEQNDKRAYIWRSDDERLVRLYAKDEYIKDKYVAICALAGIELKGE